MPGGLPDGLPDGAIRRYVAFFLGAFACWSVLVQIGVQAGITHAGTLLVLPAAGLAGLAAAVLLGGPGLSGTLVPSAVPPARGRARPGILRPDPARPAPLAFALLWGLGAAAVAAGLLLGGAARAWAPALLCLLAAGVAAAVLLRRPSPPAARTGPPPRLRLSPVAARHDAALLVLLAGLALLPLLLHRPDPDDAAFLNLAAGMIADPRPILTHDAMLGDPAQPIILPTYRIEALHALIAAVSGLTRMAPIEVAHLLWPVAAGLFVAGALYLFCRAFAGEAWLPALLLCLLLLVLQGEAHRSYGNFGFLRLQQGKSALFLGCVPLIWVFALRFWAAGDGRERRRSWALLALTQAAATGLSANAVFLCPVALLAVGLGLWLSEPARIGRLVLLGLSGIWPVAAGLMVLLTTGAYPSEFLEVPGPLADLRSVLGAEGAVLLMPAALAAGALMTGALRRAVLGAAAVFALLALNPLLDPLLARHLTGNLNWRLLFAFPAPALLAAALAGALWGAVRHGYGHGRGDGAAAAVRRRLGGGPAGPAGPPRAARWATAGLAAALALAAASPASILHPSNRVRLDPLGLDVDRGHAAAEMVRRRLGPWDVVLAPEPVAVWLATAVPPPALVAVRGVYVEHYRHTRPPGDVAARAEALALVSGRGAAVGAGPEALDAHLERFGVTVLVIPERLAEAEALAARAEAMGFRRTAASDGHLLLQRPSDETRPTG